MTGIIHYETFVITGLLLNLTPGNDTIFILTRSLAQGKKAGIMSVLGITTGSLIHTMLAALGLSIIIARSILVFTIIKYLGAAYLIYIGCRMLTDRSRLDTGGTITQQSVDLKKVYRDGVITNVLNPKVALFFISFLPQFIEPHLKETIAPFLLLGITFTITGMTWCLVLANFAASFYARLKNNKTISGYINKACGVILVGLGIKVALTTRN